MNRSAVEKAMKEAYIDARETAKIETKNGNAKEYSIRMLQALRDMAEADVYPDWRFSDEECNIWEMFCNMKVKS